MMDWNTLLPATPAPYLPTEAACDALPLFFAIGDTLESLEFSGPEATKFLQGQVTCDMNDVTAGHLRLGAHCNPKGRAQATFLAYASLDSTPEQPSITLLLPTGMAEPTAQQLQKFAMFSKVAMRQRASTDAAVAMLLGGHGAIDWLQGLGFSSPSETPLQWVANPEGLRVTAVDAHRPLYLLLCPPPALPHLLDQIPASAVLSLQNGWWQCLNAQGQAHVVPATQEEFIPQELNYDLIQGISFKKGCYKGQEIVARLHFKGIPKFRTLRFVVECPMPLLAGTHLSDASGARVGQIAQIARAGEHTYDILLVAKPDAVPENAPLVTDTGLTLRLTQMLLPGGHFPFPML